MRRPEKTITKVLLLCDNLGNAVRYPSDCGALRAIEVHYLVARPPVQSTSGFLLRVVASYVYRFRLSLMLGLLLELLRGRLHIRIEGINSPKTVEWIKAQEFDIGVHCAGVIYRKPVIDAFKMGILNAHIGALPRFRGRSVLEWSLIEGAEATITTFFIDEGIDTGPRIVRKRTVAIEGYRSLPEAKAALFALCANEYKEAISDIVIGRTVIKMQKVSDGMRYYEISMLFRGVAEKVFSEMAGQAAMGGRCGRSNDELGFPKDE